MKRWTNGLPGATKRLGANLALRGLSVSQSGCARIPMMARSKIAPLQRPNTLMQLSRSSVLELPLATRGRAIQLAPWPALRLKVRLGREFANAMFRRCQALRQRRSSIIRKDPSLILANISDDQVCFCSPYRKAVRDSIGAT